MALFCDTCHSVAGVFTVCGLREFPIKYVCVQRNDRVALLGIHFIRHCSSFVPHCVQQSLDTMQVLGRNIAHSRQQLRCLDLVSNQPISLRQLKYNVRFLRSSLPQILKIKDRILWRSSAKHPQSPCIVTHVVLFKREKNLRTSITNQCIVGRNVNRFIKYRNRAASITFAFQSLDKNSRVGTGFLKLSSNGLPSLRIPKAPRSWG